jgi:hypothetical protein
VSQGDANIYGPDNGYTFSSAQGGGAGASYVPPNSTWPGESIFQVNLKDAAVSNGGFIAFRGITLAGSTGPAPLCWYPTFDTSTGLPEPGSMVNQPTLGCVIEYLSGPAPVGHKHPNAGVSRSIGIELRVQNVDFNQLVADQSFLAEGGALTFTSYRELPCWTEADPYAAVGGHFKDYRPGSVTVTRTGADEWQVRFSLPASVYEFVPQPVTTKRGGCLPSNLGMLSVTSEMKGAFTVRRRLVS